MLYHIFLARVLLLYQRARRNTQTKSTVYGGKRYNVNAIASFSQKSFAMQNISGALILTVISSVVEKSRSKKGVIV